MTPGERTADRARKAAREVVGGLDFPLDFGQVFRRLSALTGWDAMLLCAWAVNAIHCNEVNLADKKFDVVQSESYDRVFDPVHTSTINGAAELLDLPLGAFIGFTENKGGKKKLIHAMVYAGEGMGFGVANACIFSHAKGAWEEIDLRTFFDQKTGYNAGRTMIATPVTGQTI